MWLIVDAMNVIGSRPDGWWRDRPGAVRRLAERLQGYAESTGTGITMVVDGKPLADLAEGDHASIEVAYARRGGRNAADDRIVELVEEDDDAAGLRVITSDRELRERGDGAGGVGVGGGVVVGAVGG